MWSSQVTVGCIVMWAAWLVGLILVGAGWLAGVDSVGQFGVVVGAGAASLTVIRDNNRTRRMIHAGERLRSIRSEVPAQH